MAWKRLGAALALIALAATVLLLSDLDNRREPTPAPHSAAAARAPEPGRQYRVTFAYLFPGGSTEEVVQGVIAGLAEHGFVEGQNLAIRRLHANGEVANITGMLQDADEAKPDVIVTLTTPVLAAAATHVSHSPVVFCAVSDPMRAGIGASFTDHLPHLTGIGSFDPIDKTAAAFKLLVPGIKTVGVVYNPTDASGVALYDAAVRLFPAEGLRLEAATAAATTDVQEAVRSVIGKGAQALWMLPDMTNLQAPAAFTGPARQARIPTVSNDPSMLKAGSVLDVSTGWRRVGVRAGGVAARVLLGEKPADIPIENYSEVVYTLNPDAAARIGLVYSEELRQRARSDQDRHYRFFFMDYMNSPIEDEALRGIQEGLAAAGYVRGKDYDWQERCAQGDQSLLISIAQEAQRSRCDLIFVSGTPSLQAAIRCIQGIPLVFTNVGAPHLAGAGRSDTMHLPNLTGVSTVSDFAAMMELVKRARPGARRIGTIFTAAEVNSVLYRDLLAEAAHAAGLELVAVPAETPGDLPEAAKQLAGSGVDAICQISDNLTCAGFAALTAAARPAHVPLFSFVSSMVRDGSAIAAVARDFRQCGRDAAAKAVRIMAGETPSDIPITRASRTVVIVNPKAAVAFGCPLPPDVVRLADEVVGE